MVYVNVPSPLSVDEAIPFPAAPAAGCPFDDLARRFGHVAVIMMGAVRRPGCWVDLSEPQPQCKGQISVIVRITDVRVQFCVEFRECYRGFHSNAPQCEILNIKCLPTYSQIF